MGGLYERMDDDAFLFPRFQPDVHLVCWLQGSEQSRRPEHTRACAHLATRRLPVLTQGVHHSMDSLVTSWTSVISRVIFEPYKGLPLLPHFPVKLKSLKVVVRVQI